MKEKKSTTRLLTAKSGDMCLKAGYWKNIENGTIQWFRQGDIFNELQLIPYNIANYEYIGEEISSDINTA